MTRTFELHMIVEELQGQLYAWNKRTNEFLGQGATVEKLFTRLQDAVPNNSTVVFRIAREEGGKILYERGLTESVEFAILDDEE